MQEEVSKLLRKSNARRKLGAFDTRFRGRHGTGLQCAHLRFGSVQVVNRACLAVLSIMQFLFISMGT